MRKIGYARVSTLDQNLDLQIDALKALGVDKIYSDKASGAKKDRPELNKALKYLKKGDTLVVWRLDRLGRSLPHLLDVVLDLEKRGVGFRTLQGGIDTTTTSGRLIFHIFGALAEFERELLRERVLAGLESARKRGRIGGRPRSLSKDKIAVARNLAASGSTQAEIAELLKVSPVTLWRALKQEKGE